MEFLRGFQSSLWAGAILSPENKQGKYKDFGCWLWHRLGRGTFGNVYGLDISPRSIKEAANRLDGVCTCLGEELPLKNAMSDVIVCTETIEHFISPVRALAEFNRVLEPNGYLILSTPNPWYWQILANRIIATLRRQRAGSGQVIENYISPIQLKAMLRRSGFEIKEFRTVYFKPGSLYKIVKKLSNGFGLYQICLARKARNICSKHATWLCYDARRDAS
jgi:SAM-dependent methyltransferase